LISTYIKRIWIIQIISISISGRLKRISILKHFLLFLQGFIFMSSVSLILYVFISKWVNLTRFLLKVIFYVLLINVSLILQRVVIWSWSFIYIKIINVFLKIYNFWCLNIIAVVPIFIHYVTLIVFIVFFESDIWSKPFVFFLILQLVLRHDFVMIFYQFV
jgi:hypothetical protein